LFAGGDSNLYGYVSNNPVNLVDPWGLERFHSPDGTHPFGRPGTIVPPGGRFGTFAENNVGSGYTFADNHDTGVHRLTDECGLPDPLVNIPTMVPIYFYSIIKDISEIPEHDRPKNFPLIEIRW
jgi:hypothetical protein